MEINISFSELSDYIKHHYGKVLTFSRLSSKEMRVTYEQNLVFKRIHVPVDIHVAEVRSDSVSIVYSGGFGIDMIISGALAFLKTKLPELSEALISEDGHRVRIEFSRLSQTKAIVEAMKLVDLKILEDGIQVSASLK